MKFSVNKFLIFF